MEPVTETGNPDRFSVSEDGRYLIIGASGVEIDGEPGVPVNGWFKRLDNGARYHYKNGRFHDDGDKPGCILPDDRGFVHYHEGKIHRDEGWAVDLVTADGDKRKVKYRHGNKHAVGEAAEMIVHDNGTQFIGWYEDNLLHREDGSAFTVINAAGDIIAEEFRIRGVLHRVDGPAYVTKNYMEYRQEGELHRLGGPAIIGKNGEQYFIQGRETDRHESNLAYIENRNETIGRAKKSDLIPGDEEEKNKAMANNIMNWKKDREKSQVAKKPRM